MTKKTDALEILRLALDDPSAEFRDGQWEAIDALANRRERLLVVQRTGWGKSSVYFISTRIFRDHGYGPTLIISPLLALMRDQIKAAKRLGIRAVTINSTNRKNWTEIEHEVRKNRVDVLLVSPERLANDEFVENILLPIAEKIGLLVVDEAHCISDWGHDFRPDYCRLVNILQRMPDNVPILGTTATANNRVIEDIQNQFGNIGVERGSLMRSSLGLQTIQLSTQAARLAWLSEHINALPGTGIIYTLTKRDARQVTGWLQSRGIKAEAYFSNVKSGSFSTSNAFRQHLEQQLLNNEIKVLVATTALGMGFDKPDLGFVIHYQAPGSIVAYYQQVGRAGRAIKHAVGILMSGDGDSQIHEFFRKNAFPREIWVRKILDMLEKNDGLTLQQIEKSVNLKWKQIKQVLEFLSVENPAPIIKSGTQWQRTPVPYQMDHDRIERLTEQRENEWNEVRRYISHDGCLMNFLAESLNDANLQPCGQCARCLEQPIISQEITHITEVAATRYLRHNEIRLHCKKQFPKDAFPEYNLAGNIPESLRAKTGMILSRWKDAGWGQFVAEDRDTGHFRDELVNATVEMLNDRWQPALKPEWVSCIPSLNRPALVSDFSRRLAEALELPFYPVIKKVKENEIQEIQRNKFYRCRNLDGVFRIDRPVPEGPVLLVDDVVDSAWTLTIAAVLLGKAGSGPVWPCALTTSNIGT